MNRNGPQRQTKEDQNQVGYIFLADLANELGLDRSFLHQKAKREHVRIIQVPRMTDGGAQNCSAVPITWANKLSAVYMAARENERESLVRQSDQAEVR